MRFSLILAFIVLSAFSAHTKKASGPDLGALKQSTAKYRSAKTVEMALTRTVKSEITGKENIYKGTIYLASGLFRIENSHPEKSVLVFDGANVWNEQAASEDFPGPAQVTKTKVSGKDKSQVLFASLLTRDPITKNFKITSGTKEGSTVIYEAQPLQSDINVKSLTLKIDDKTKLISEISYKDDLDNLTIMKFSDPQFKSSFNKALFQYKPPKGAQVTEI